MSLRNVDDDQFDEFGKPRKVQREKSDFEVLIRLFKFVAQPGFQKYIVLLLFLSLLGAILGFFSPYIIRDIINVGIGGGIPDAVIQSTVIKRDVILLGLIMVIDIGFWFGQSYTTMTLANRSMYEMRQQLFTNLQRLSLDFYSKPGQSVGKTLSYLTNDVDTIQELIQSGLLTVITKIISLAGSLVFMIQISGKMTLVAFGIAPVILVIAIIVFRLARRYYVLLRRRVAGVTAHLNESITGMRVVKAFGVESDDFHNFSLRTNAELSVNLRSIRLFSIMPAIMILTIGGSIGTILLAGSYFYYTEGLAIGDIIAFLLYLIGFMEPLMTILSFFALIQNSMSAGERIVKIIDMSATIVEIPNATALSRVEGRIDFQNVSFAYVPTQPVLQNLNLAIHPKERIAIVGFSGAGKTTLITLLSRFYDVNEGAILLDGLDLRTLTFASIRHHIGVVLQDNFLFTGTVKDNIRYGKPSATDEEVITAAKEVGAHEFILDLSQGYDTEVREFGNRLSVGQKQLIAFARALLIDPPILILDEATSAVDPYSELIIQRALETLLKNRTSITIAHRLSTILHADRIVVLEKGQIIEEGTHDQLVHKQDGLYRHLYYMQFKDPFRHSP